MSTKLCKCGGEIKEYDMLFECIDCMTKVWKYSHGRKFNEREVYRLLNGETLLLNGFKSRNGTRYNTKVNIQNKEINLIFDDDTSSTILAKCSCEGNVIKIPKGYKCTNCNRVVWEKFIDRKLKLYQVKELFIDKSISIRDIKSKYGNYFNAELFFNGSEIEIEYS